MCAASRVLAVALTLGLAAPASADVLVVGDSLGVGTTPHLRAQLAGVRVDGDSRIGRPSGEGVRVLGERIGGGHDVVVFDLGTNDDPRQPGVLARNLAAARELAGERCMVVATINRPPLNGVSSQGLNAAVDSFAASDDAVEVADWRGLVAADPSLLAGDGVHATPQGYAVRGELMAEAVRACREGDRSEVESEDSSGPAPSPRRRRPREREVPVPGIESSGVLFSEPVEWRGAGGTRLRGDLLLPAGRGPHPAVVVLHAAGAQTRSGYREQAQAFARAGVAALIFDKRRGGHTYATLAADARAAVAALARREDVRRGAIALWGVSEGGLVAALAAAGNTGVAAVAAVSPVVLPPVRADDWSVREALAEADAGSGTAALTSAWRLAADLGEPDRRLDPAPVWRGVAQPVFVAWGAADDVLPARASALGLAAALAAGRNADRTFRTFAGAGHRVDRLVTAQDAAAQWLQSRLARRRARPAVSTPLPPAGEVEPVAVERAGFLASVPAQAAWLLLPVLLLAAGGLAGRRRPEPPGSAAPVPRRLAIVVVALHILTLAALAGAVAAVLAADGRDVAALGGMPAAIAGTFAIAACALAATVALAVRVARSRPPAPFPLAAVLAGGLWLALAAYWLL